MTFTKWLRELRSLCRRDLITRKNPRAARYEPPKRIRLQLEALEDRLTPSFSPATIYAVDTSPQAVKDSETGTPSIPFGTRFAP